MAEPVPGLAEQEAEGQFREAVQLIVDGVVEDIRSGHTVWRRHARSQGERNAYQTRYAKEFASAVEAIKYGGDLVPMLTIRKIAAQIIWAAVRRELKGRPEYAALPKENDTDG